MTWKIIKTVERQQQFHEIVDDGDSLHIENGIVLFTDDKIPGTFSLTGLSPEDEALVFREDRIVKGETFNMYLRGRGAFYVEPHQGDIISAWGFYYASEVAPQIVALHEKEVGKRFSSIKNRERL